MLEITEQNFSEVVKQSEKSPVLVDFYADWCEPCKAISPVLEKLAVEYKDKILFAQVNADEQQAICAQFAVRSLPNLKLLFEGQVISELAGAHPESDIRAFLAPVLGDEAFLPSANAIQEVKQARESGDFERALGLLQQLIQEQPDNQEHIVLLADLLMDMDKIDDAKTALNTLSSQNQDVGIEGFKRVKARINFYDRIQEIDNKNEIMVNWEKNQEDLTLNFNVGLILISQGKIKESLERFLFIMSQNRDYQDGEARKMILEIFEMLGKENPMVSRYRRKLYNLLH